jgi:hypothetical protein
LNSKDEYSKNSLLFLAKFILESELRSYYDNIPLIKNAVEKKNAVNSRAV